MDGGVLNVLVQNFCFGSIAGDPLPGICSVFGVSDTRASTHKRSSSGSSRGFYARIYGN